MSIPKIGIIGPAANTRYCAECGAPFHPRSFRDRLCARCARAMRERRGRGR